MEIPTGADGEEIREFDLVELVEPYEAHDSGARGTVVLIGGNGAMIDFAWADGHRPRDSHSSTKVPYERVRLVRRRIPADHF
jgi:hypothetical protein